MRMFSSLACLAVAVLMWSPADARDPSDFEAAASVATRTGVTVPLLWAGGTGELGTALLIPGGSGGPDHFVAGAANGDNVLIRAHHLFVEEGLDVFIMGRPSDTADLTYSRRVTVEHRADLEAVLDYVRSHSTKRPLWVVGTSRGSISAAILAKAAPGILHGVVLTSAINDPGRPGSLVTQDLSSIRSPVLVVYNANDECDVSRPDGLRDVLRRFSGAAPAQGIMLAGGGPVSGRPCSSLHFHGYVGAENEFVRAIVGWMKSVD